MRVPHCGQVTFGVKDSILSNDPLADIGPPRSSSDPDEAMRLTGRQSIPKTNFYLLKVRCSFSNEERFNLDTASRSRF